jgi:hypothetical protein
VKPALTTKTFGEGNQKWLGSRHGIDAVRTITLDASTFTLATHYPSGYLFSGIVLGIITATGKYGPYDDAASDGRQVARGILFTDVEVNPANSPDVDPVGPMFTMGVVIEANLPTGNGIDAAGKTDLTRIEFR